MSGFRFELEAVDPETGARAGRCHTPHGSFETPIFMPVGTRGTLRGLTIDHVAATQPEILLANTYHLMQRPGETVVRDLGGIQRFMGWNGPVLTDSGGFQIWSLAERVQRDEDGVTFKSEIDGDILRLTPERAIAVQEDLGADIIMPLDDCAEYPASRRRAADAVDLSVRWLERCRAAQTRDDQALFGIVQGGVHIEERVRCAEAMAGLDLPGYAVGGFSVGEPRETTYPVLADTNAALPTDKPRYVMGIGSPVDFLDAVLAGTDMMDCVLPTRNARHTMALTRRGPVRFRNLRHQRDPRPIDPDCTCFACRTHSRGYIRHLFVVREPLGPTLLSIHNLHYMFELVHGARAAIREGRFGAYRREILAGLEEGDLPALDGAPDASLADAPRGGES